MSTFDERYQGTGPEGVSGVSSSSSRSSSRSSSSRAIGRALRAPRGGLDDVLVLGRGAGLGSRGAFEDGAWGSRSRNLASRTSRFLLIR